MTLLNPRRRSELPRKPVVRQPVARRAGVAALAAVAALLLSAAGGAAEGPQRVVSIGGALTEIIYRLGQQDRVVAVDVTSVYPPEAMATKPNVGYMRALSAEGVLAVEPDLILAVEGSGPPEALEVLGKAAVPVVMIPDKHTPEGIADKIRKVAAVFGVDAEGEALATEVTQQIAAVEAAVANVTAKRRVIFVLSFAGGRIMAAGANTAADSMIRLAGAENALSGFDGYKTVTDEAVTAAAPDMVLTMRNGPEPMPAEEVFALPALAATPAGAAHAYVAIDGQFLLGFGPRTADAIRDLAAALYPDLPLPAAGAAAQ